jgi:hypothetical protein
LKHKDQHIAFFDPRTIGGSMADSTIPKDGEQENPDNPRAFDLLTLLSPSSSREAQRK